MSFSQVHHPKLNKVEGPDQSRRAWRGFDIIHIDARDVVTAESRRGLRAQRRPSKWFSLYSRSSCTLVLSEKFVTSVAFIASIFSRARLEFYGNYTQPHFILDLSCGKPIQNFSLTVMEPTPIFFLLSCDRPLIIKNDAAEIWMGI